MSEEGTVCTECGTEIAADAAECSNCVAIFEAPAAEAPVDDGAQRKYIHRKSEQAKKLERSGYIGCLAVGAVVGVLATLWMWSANEGWLRYVFTAVIALSWLGFVAQWALKAASPIADEDVLTLSKHSVDLNGTTVYLSDVDQIKIDGAGPGGLLSFSKLRPRRILLAVRGIEEWEDYDEIMATLASRWGKPIS